MYQYDFKDGVITGFASETANVDYPFKGDAKKFKSDAKKNGVKVEQCTALLNGIDPDFVVK